MKTTFFMLIILVQGLLIMQSCKELGLCKDAKLGFARQENTLNALRLGGFFYWNIPGEDPDAPNIYFLYQNGIFYNNYSSNIREIISNQANFDNSELRKSVKNSWGIYRVVNREIEIQYWAPTYLGVCDKIVIEKGEIINDSTFILTSSKVSDNKEIQSIRDTYHFHPYSPKPDSIVNFIK